MSSDVLLGRLDQVLSFANGRSSPDRNDSARFAVFGSNGLIGRATETNSQSSTIVIGRVGSYCGSVHYSKDKCWVTDNAIRATAKGENDPLFLYYLLKHLNLNNWRSGSGQPLINQTTLSAIETTIPHPNEQRAISSFVGVLDDRITLLRETNATLEAIAQTLFKSWFVDFDPVRAKMEGRTPEGMDEATAALFPDSFEPSELGEIPSGWQVGTVSSLGDVVCGKTPATSLPENYGNEVPFITIPDMHNQLVVTRTNKNLSRLGADSQRKKYLPAGSVCVSCIATPGLVSLVTAKAQTNQQINSVVPFECWGKSFPLFLLRRIGDAVRSGGSGGSIFHNLNKSGFEKLPVLLTSESLAKKFDALIKPIIAKIINNQEQLQDIADLRDTLLPRLISGQLRLPEAEKQATEALA